MIIYFGMYTKMQLAIGSIKDILTYLLTYLLISVRDLVVTLDLLRACEKQ